MTKCTGCLQLLDVGCFYARPGGKHRQPCKKCTSEQNKEYREQPVNLERKNQRQRHRYKNDVEYRQRVLRKSKKYRRRHYLKVKFNLTESQVEEMRYGQGNICLICRREFDNETMKHCIDHCHATGEVRGLLCPLCNKGLGLFKDDVVRLQQAIDYLNVRITHGTH